MYKNIDRFLNTIKFVHKMSVDITKIHLQQCVELVHEMWTSYAQILMYLITHLCFIYAIMLFSNCLKMIKTD